MICNFSRGNIERNIVLWRFGGTVKLQCSLGIIYNHGVCNSQFPVNFSINIDMAFGIIFHNYHYLKTHRFISSFLAQLNVSSPIPVSYWHFDWKISFWTNTVSWPFYPGGLVRWHFSFVVVNNLTVTKFWGCVFDFPTLRHTII